jgi:cysteine desulfurase
MQQKIAYFDYAASTPLDPRVFEAMKTVALEPGNPSAVHGAGRSARARLDRARRQVADWLGAKSGEIVFTSGATEAANAAVRGWWHELEARGFGDGKILVSALEHASVRKTIDGLAARGARIEVVPVTASGVIDLAALEAALADGEVALVAVMWVSNVLGTRQPVEQIGKLVKQARGARGHGGRPIAWLCDAVQAARFEALRPTELGVDFMALSAHKVYGPTGVGCLWQRSGLAVAPLITGGGQESGRRGGTENAMGIVGFGAAAELMTTELASDLHKARQHRRRLLDQLGRPVVGDEAASVPGISYMMAKRQRGEDLALRLDVAGLAVATGSACDAGNRKGSSALAAALGEQAAGRGGVRLSWGRFTTDDEIDRLRAALLAADA